MDWYLALAWVFIGGFVGSFITRFIYRATHAHGTLTLDSSDPEKDSYIFDGFDREILQQKKYLELRIIRKNVR